MTRSAGSSPGVLRCRESSSWAAVPDYPQTLKREVLLDTLDRGRLSSEDVRHSPGRNAQRTISIFQLGPHPCNDPVDQRYVAEEQAGLHRGDRRLPNHGGRLPDINARQPGSALEQRIRGNPDARADHTA